MAIADGIIVSVVDSSKSQDANGQLVLIRHVEPESRMVIYMLYAHLMDVGLRRGDPVVLVLGSVLGRMWRPTEHA